MAGGGARAARAEGGGPGGNGLRSWGVLGTGMVRWWQALTRAAGRYPWPANVLLYAGFFSGGDALQQLLRGGPADWQHTQHVATVAVAFHANFNYVWLRLLERALPGRAPRTILAKVLCDQALGGPVYVSTFYAGEEPGRDLEAELGTGSDPELGGWRQGLPGAGTEQEPGALWGGGWGWKPSRGGQGLGDWEGRGESGRSRCEDGEVWAPRIKGVEGKEIEARLLETPGIRARGAHLGHWGCK